MTCSIIARLIPGLRVSKTETTSSMPRSCPTGCQGMKFEDSHPFKTSSFSGSHGPSLHSSNTVPGSKAFSIRWERSSGLFRRSRFIRRRGDTFASAVRASRVCWSMIKAYLTIFGIPFNSFWMYSRLAIFALVSSRFSRFVLSELNSSIVARLTSPSLKYLS